MSHCQRSLPGRPGVGFGGALRRVRGAWPQTGPRWAAEGQPAACPWRVEIQTLEPWGGAVVSCLAGCPGQQPCPLLPGLAW